MPMLKTKIKLSILILSLITLIFCLLFATDKIVSMSVVAAIMAIWWIFEILPLGITGLLPLVAYPLLGIMSTKSVAPIYMSSILLLFVGGFFVAIAMQRWNLHKRIALNIISFFGSKPTRLVLGFMVASAFLSMWISNTAATVMMVSIGLAMVKSYEEIEGEGKEADAFASTLMMAIAYAATIGGMATLIGTPPNLALTRIYALSFPNATEISFGAWATFGIPTTIILVGFAWLVLTKVQMGKHRIKELGPDIIENEKKKLGSISYEEKWVFVVFVTMALLWIFRKNLNLGIVEIPGWSNLLPHPKLIDDGTVAIAMAMILFMVPSRNPAQSKRLLDSSAINQIPWQTILLFGGGFALAKGIQSSGLSAQLGQQFIGLKDVSHPVIVISITAGMSFLTELTSNMASTEMLLPILASISKATGMLPLSIMIPATLAASAAFMLPAATAPNAIIFGSDRVKISDMVKNGFIINIISIFVISLICLFVMPHILY
jgi:sodium-dependent dicarboxylate transporter 2/3/5